MLSTQWPERSYAPFNGMLASFTLARPPARVGRRSCIPSVEPTQNLTNRWAAPNQERETPVWRREGLWIYARFPNCASRASAVELRLGLP